MSWRNLSRSGLMRQPKQVLINAHLELTDQNGKRSYHHPATKAGLVDKIAEALAEDSERRFREAIPNAAPKASLCKFPARDVNAWLRSIA